MHIIRKRPHKENSPSKIPYDQLTPSARLELDSRPGKKASDPNMVDLRKKSALAHLEALFAASEDCIPSVS